MAQPQGNQRTDKSRNTGLSRLAQRVRYRPRYWMVSSAILIASLAFIVVGLFLRVFRTFFSFSELDSLLIDIGTNLIGAVAAFIAFDVFLGNVERSRIKIYPVLTNDMVINMVRSAEDQIRIMETWTVVVLEKNKGEEFCHAIEEALNRNVKIRILLLEPGSLTMSQRQSDLLQDPEVVDVESNILINLRIFYGIDRRRSGNLFEVRLYDQPPSIALYNGDNRALAAFYPPDTLSIRSEQLEFLINSELGQWVIREFNGRWGSEDDAERKKDLSRAMYLEKIELIFTDSVTSQETSISYDNVEYVRNEIDDKAKNSERSGYGFYILNAKLVENINAYHATNCRIKFNNIVYRVRVVSRQEHKRAFDLFSAKYERKPENLCKLELV